MALTCLVGLMMLASCKKDPIAPTITAIQNEGYATENTQIYSGDEITVGFNATGEKLTKIEITLTENGTVIDSRNQILENVATYSYSASFTVQATGAVTVTGIVTDAVGQTATKSFNINCNEKPNTKFIGHYQGNALFNGYYEASITGVGEPMHQDFTDHEIPVIVEIAAGESMNEVVATCHIEDRTMTVNGTVEGDVITFEAIDDVVTFNYDLSGFTISPEVSMTYTIAATLADGQLRLEGTCTGEGEIHALIYNGTLALDGTIGGSLEKTE